MSTDDTRAAYPSDVLQMASSANRPTDHTWWLVRVKPRQEKAVASELRNKHVAYYLPMVTRKSLSRGRTRVAKVILFPGYVFAWGDSDARTIAMSSKLVESVRSAPHQEVFTSQLQQFMSLIERGAPLLPESRLFAGEQVRVKSGPFRGQEGVIIRRNGKTRIFIAIDYLEQGASLEVDDSILERLTNTQVRFEGTAEARSDLSPPAVIIAWSPDQITENEYARLVAAIGDLARVEGGAGIRRLQSRGIGAFSESGVVF